MLDFAFELITKWSIRSKDSNGMCESVGPLYHPYIHCPLSFEMAQKWNASSIQPMFICMFSISAKPVDILFANPMNLPNICCWNVHTWNGWMDEWMNVWMKCIWWYGFCLIFHTKTTNHTSIFITYGKRIRNSLPWIFPFSTKRSTLKPLTTRLFNRTGNDNDICLCLECEEKNA